MLTVLPGNGVVYSFAGIVLSQLQLSTLALELICLTVFFGGMYGTSVGLRIRALTDNHGLYEAIGFDLTTVRLVVTGLAFGIVGFVGALYSLDYGVYPAN